MSSILYLFTAFFALSRSQKYQIELWNLTIYDPARPTHKIPMDVAYPTTGSDFPVVIVTHGWEGRVRWYDYIRDNLVPQGYVVAYPCSEENLGASGKILATDARYLLDYLVDNSKSNQSSPVYGKVGTKYMITGHSMGGEAAILAATDYNLGEKFENSFDAMMTLSACGGNTERKALETMKKPSFIMSGDSDCTCNPNSTSIPFYNVLNTHEDECEFLAIIKDGIHCFFCDFDYDTLVDARIEECLLFMNPCGPQLEMHAQINLINRYMSLFMDAVVTDNSKNQYQQIETMLADDLKSGAMAIVQSNCTM